MTYKKLAALLCVSLSFLMALSCLTLPALADDSAFSSLSDWQGDLDPDTPITEVNIPGTHDSAMFGIGSGLFEGAGFAHNQDKTFAEQLAMGVRYIDGRFCYLDKKNRDEKENIFCCHGGYIPEMNGKDITLGDLLRELNTFLDDHPTEFIFLPYKCESEEDMSSGNLNNLLSQIFYELAEDRPERYMIAHQGDSVPTVWEAQGHIILTINSNSGIFCDVCCIANTYSSGTDEKVKELAEVFAIENVRPLTKDHRTFTYKSSTASKSERSPRLIHTSCYQAPFRTPARTSADIYKWITGKVEKLDGVAHPTFYKGYYYGIVLFDYVKEDECRLIIELNNPTDPSDPGTGSGTGEGDVPATGTVLGDSENMIGMVVITVVFAAIIASAVVLGVRKKRRRNA